MRASIHILTKGRNSGLALLLESLRRQTLKQWDVVIMDNNRVIDQQIKIGNDFVIQAIFQRLQFEGHRVFVIDNENDIGPRDIGRYRNMIIEMDPFRKDSIAIHDTNRTNEIGVRLDDDSIIENNYLEIVMDAFKDPKVAISGGICPYYWQPNVHAPIPARFNEITRFFEWTDNCVNFYRMLDEKGNDRHWSTTFFESGHIRSNYAYRIDIAQQIKWPEYTGPTGFTEETGFCAKAWMLGYKVLINPNAIAWHLHMPMGGGRDTIKSPEDMENIKKVNLEAIKKDLTEFRDKLGLEPCPYPP